MHSLAVRQFVEFLSAGPYTWPGGYPIYFVTADGGVISFEAAKENKDLIIDAIRSGTDSQWHVVACDINWESHITCDHTGKDIESAYEIQEREIT